MRGRAAVCLVIALGGALATSSARAGEPAAGAWLGWDDVEAARPEDAGAVAERLAKALMGDARVAYARSLEAAAREALDRFTAQDKKLHDAMDAAGYGVGTGSGAGSGGIGSGSGTAGGLGASGIDLQGVLLGGLVRFVERRAREESISWTMQLLRTRLCHGGRRPVRPLFPTTCGLLDGVARLDSSISPLAMLRYAIERDLGELPEHMFDAARALGAAGGGLRCGLGLARSFDRLVVAGHAPGVLVAAVSAAMRVEDCGRMLGFADRRAAEQGTVRISAALALVAGSTDGGSTAGSIEEDAIGKLDTATAALDLPAGVETLADQAQEADEGLASLLETVTGDENAPAPLKKAAGTIAAEHAKASAVFTAAREEIARTYASAVAARSEPIRRLVRKLSGPAGATAGGLRDLRGGSKTDEERRAHYLAAVRGAADVAEVADLTVASAPSIPTVEGVFELVDGAQELRAGNHAAGFTSLFASGAVPMDQEPFRSVLQMSELLIGIAGASTSDEIAAVIEAAAPRPGGWKRKRQTATRGLGAQFGIAGGPEWTLAGDGHARDVGTAMAVSLPIGLDLARPLGRHSIGLLLQVLDLGAVSSLRFGSGAAERRAELELTSVFAPGAVLYLGLGQSPFLVAVGASYVAGLRAREDGSVADVLRVQASLAIDVPLLEF